MYQLDKFAKKYLNLGNAQVVIRDWCHFLAIDSRGTKAFKNILLSLFCKGFRLVIGFLLVPLSIDYLNPTKYGVWLIIFSVLMWMRLLDVGFGNGLRNRLTEAIARDDITLARAYVSTTYFIVSCLIFISFVSFLGLQKWIDWCKVLNAPPQMSGEIKKTVILVFGFICITFILQLIIRVCQADQRPAYREVVDLLSSGAALLLVLALQKFYRSSLVLYGAVVTATPVLVLIGLHIGLFCGRYKDFLPSSKFIDITLAKDLSRLGMNFFIIQIASVILFSTDNFLIGYLVEPAEVARVNIAIRYFGVIITIFSIIITPFWSAVTDAFHRNEIRWIKKTVGKLLTIWGGATVVCLFMLLFSEYFYSIWIGKRLVINFSISLIICILVIVRTFGAIFTHVINGLGMLKIQTINAIVAAILNIPLSIIFAKSFKMGSIGVVLATVLISFAGGILRFIQYLKIVNGTATGIWVK